MKLIMLLVPLLFLCGCDEWEENRSKRDLRTAQIKYLERASGNEDALALRIATQQEPEVRVKYVHHPVPVRR